MQVSQSDYEKFVKYQEAQKAKALANKRWNAKLRLLAQKAQEAGMTVTDEEIEAWLAGNKEINL